MEHLEENILALYVMDAPEIKERRAEIAAHLDECAGCAQILAEMKDYYSQVDALRTKEDEQVHPALQESAWIARRGYESDRGAVPAPSRSAVQVFVTSVKTYPVRWSGAFAVVAAALLFLVPKIVAIDRNPMIVRAKDEFLVAFNRNSQELWKTYVGPGYEQRTHNAPMATVSELADVDGNGKNATFLLLPDPGSVPDDYQSTAIACYAADGSDRWRFEFRPPMVFGRTRYSGDYYLNNPLIMGDFSGSGRKVIAFAAHHYVWWPAAVGLLDTRTGKVLSEYWHPGWVRIKPVDVDHDGVQEIIVAGYSNAFKLNALAVLDPNKMEGSAPTTEEYKPQGIRPATEKYYILLPDADLFHLSSRVPVEQNMGISPINTLEVRTIRYLEVGKEGRRVAEVFFEFDERLNCVKVRPGDEFVDMHHSMEKEGRVKRKLDEGYFDELRRNVQYWDGEKFVKEPTMNKKYVSSK